VKASTSWGNVPVTLTVKVGVAIRLRGWEAATTAARRNREEARRRKPNAMPMTLARRAR
jgi:hypothetical protein